MNFSDERNFSSYFIIIAVLVITGLILWNTSLFMRRLKDDERTKVQIWIEAQKAFDSEELGDYIDLSLLISSTNNSNPIVITDANKEFQRDTLGAIRRQSLQNIPENLSDS